MVYHAQRGNLRWLGVLVQGMVAERSLASGVRLPRVYDALVWIDLVCGYLRRQLAVASRRNRSNGNQRNRKSIISKEMNNKQLGLAHLIAAAIFAAILVASFIFKL